MHTHLAFFVAEIVVSTESSIPAAQDKSVTSSTASQQGAQSGRPMAYKFTESNPASSNSAYCCKVVVQMQAKAGPGERDAVTGPTMNASAHLRSSMEGMGLQHWQRWGACRMVSAVPQCQLLLP